MTKTIWVSTSAATTYVPREKPIQESVAPFSGTISGAAPATTNLGTNSGQRILAADGTWIPQPAFTSGGADQLETLRPSVISPSYSANPPTVTDSAKAYDVDTNHATTFGQWYAAQEARTNNRVDIFSLTTWASKTQTWTAATINVSRSYAILQDGESSATSGSSSKTSSVKYEFSTNNGSSWTTLGTDTAASIPTAPQTLSMALGSLTPTMGNILVKVTITRGGGGTIYEDGVSLPGLTGEVDLKLFDVWIDGTYAGGAGNITCNNLTVTGDATFQNKIYDSTASAGTTGQVLKVAANGKVTWATDSAGTGTVTSITTTGANGVTISGGSTQTITTSGTFALALGNITPTSISTGTGSFSGDVEFAASIKSPNGSNSPIVIVPDGTGDLHVNADSLRLGDNNADATIATNGTGDLILTTHEGSATQGIIRLYDGANGNITLTPNGTGQVQVGSDQVVTLTASQTLTNKTLSTSSTWNGNVIGSAYGGAGTVNGILKANGSGTVSAASAGTDYVTSVSVTSPVSNTGTTANPTIALASGYGDTQNPYGSKTANYFLAAPNGTAGVPTFRAIVAADIPTLNQSTTGTAANITATSNTTLTTLSNLVSIGTITTGTWNASAIGVAYGGTGLTTLTAGYIPYGSGTSAFGSSANLFWDSTNSRLGVGTASPGSKLHIANPANTTTYLQIAQTSVESWQIGMSANSTALAFLNSGSEKMRLTDSGNLGLGTSSPSFTLDISAAAPRIRQVSTTGTNSSLLQLQNTGGTAYIGLDNSAGGLSTAYSLNLYHAGAYPIVFSTNNAERMRITSGGDVGIGTSSPTYRLQVSASDTSNVVGGSAAAINITNSNAAAFNRTVDLNFSVGGGATSERIAGLSAIYTTYGTSVGGALAFCTNNGSASFAERMRITSGGEVLIGNTNGTEKLTVTGNIRASGVYVGNGSTGDWNKGFGGIKLTTTTSTPTGGQSGDFVFIY